MLKGQVLDDGFNHSCNNIQRDWDRNIFPAEQCGKESSARLQVKLTWFKRPDGDSSGQMKSVFFRRDPGQQGFFSFISISTNNSLITKTLMRPFLLLRRAEGQTKLVIHLSNRSKVVFFQDLKEEEERSLDGRELYSTPSGVPPLLRSCRLCYYQHSTQIHNG